MGDKSGRAVWVTSLGVEVASLGEEYRWQVLVVRLVTNLGNAVERTIRRARRFIGNKRRLAAKIRVFLDVTEPGDR